jgi:hypothetical protein
MMNHPKPGEWVPYLYGEAEPKVQRRMREHLHDCAECRDQLKSWQGTQGRLNAWKLPRVRPAVEPLAPFLKWAVAAAAIFLVAGFGVGRLSAPRLDLESIRAGVEPQIRQALRQEMAQMLSEEVTKAASATLVAADQQAEQVAATYARALYLSLKNDVDTVALNADAGLRQTEQQIVQLADHQPLGGTAEEP